MCLAPSVYPLCFKIIIRFFKELQTSIWQHAVGGISMLMLSLTQN